MHGNLRIENVIDIDALKRSNVPFDPKKRAGSEHYQTYQGTRLVA